MLPPRFWKLVWLERRLPNKSHTTWFSVNTMFLFTKIRIVWISGHTMSIERSCKVFIYVSVDPSEWKLATHNVTIRIAPLYAIHLARRIQVILRWETQKKLSLVQSVIFLPISHKTRSSFPPSNLPCIIFILLLSFFKTNPFAKGGEKKKELPLNCLRQIRTKRNQKSRKKKGNTRTKSWLPFPN